MGKGDIVRDFNVSGAERRDPTPTACGWIPRPAGGIRLAGDRRRPPLSQIRGLTAADAQGGRSTFSFSNFKENLGLADKMFQFTTSRVAPRSSAVARPLDARRALTVALAGGLLWVSACASGTRCDWPSRRSAAGLRSRGRRGHQRVLRKNPRNAARASAAAGQKRRLRRAHYGAGDCPVSSAGGRRRVSARHGAQPDRQRSMDQALKEVRVAPHQGRRDERGPHQLEA